MAESFKIAPLLEVFLLETHSYDQFVHNVRIRIGEGLTGVIISIDSIGNAFLWKDTEEGQKYWRNLHIQFYKLNNY